MIIFHPLISSAVTTDDINHLIVKRDAGMPYMEIGVDLQTDFAEGKVGDRGLFKLSILFVLLIFCPIVLFCTACYCRKKFDVKVLTTNRFYIKHQRDK